MIKNYLKQIIKLKLGKPQQQFYKWVLKNGKSFNGIQINSKVMAELKNASNNKQRQCFYNSQMLALNGKYEYYEGWYVTEGINLPLEHGWNVLNGKVVDVTKRFNVNEYFGIKIPMNYVKKMLVKTGYSDGFLGRYYDEVKNGKSKTTKMD